MKSDSYKSTLMVISAGSLIVYLISSWQWTIFLSLIVGIIGITSPWLSKKIEWVWMKLSKLLSYIVPNILLSIVFIFFLFPIALLYRIFAKDPLMLSKQYNTYFIDINKKMDKKSFEKIW